MIKSPNQNVPTFEKRKATGLYKTAPSIPPPNKFSDFELDQIAKNQTSCYGEDFL